MIALVTGGGRGIGRGIALYLAREGWDVAISARSADELRETAALANRSILTVPADVSKPAVVSAMVETVESKLGPIDLLVNNAGVAGPLDPFLTGDPEAWWRCQEVNVLGPALCSRAVLPGMIARRSGRIVNVASGAGCQPVENMSAYVVSKTALIRLSEQLGLELASHGIAVFAIRPGVVRTAMVENARRRIHLVQQFLDDGIDVAPEVVGALVAKLASGRADALSGRLISVDDDFEALVREAAAIPARELYVLRVKKL